MVNVRQSAVYRITHEASGKCYIGSTIDLRMRWNRHRCELRKNRHHSFMLQRAWNKYGAAAFIWEIVELVPADKTTLEKREAYWITTLQPVYNRSLTVNRHRIGTKLSEATKEKKSRALKGKPWSPDRRAQNPLSPIHTRPRQRKITQAQVDEIRVLYAQGGISQRKIAQRYGISQGAVWDLLTRRTWTAEWTDR